VRFSNKLGEEGSAVVWRNAQLQLKARLSSHCVANRGLPFLFEIVVGKTALHKRQGSMYDQSHCCELARFDSRQTGE